MSGKISASIMCADLLNLESEIKHLDSLGVDYLHLDFMDGNFVSNIAFGIDFFKSFRKLPKKMQNDIHIMAFSPENYLDRLEIEEGDLVSFHYEACNNHLKVIEKIKSRGALPMLAISPDTDINVVDEFLPFLSGVLIMTVYPGDTGRPLAPNSFERIKQLKTLVEKHCSDDFIIEVDGCVSWENAPKMRAAGANLFVTGTSSIFKQPHNYSQNVPKFKSLIP